MIDWSPVLLSLRVGLSALAVIFVLGTLAARAMTRRHFPGKDVVDGLLVLPLVSPPWSPASSCWCCWGGTGRSDG